MRLTTFTVFVAALLSFGAFTHGAEVVAAKITVDPGAVPRRNAPVAATIDAPAISERDLGDPFHQVHYVLKHEGASIAVQLEVVNGKAVLRWIEPDARPGTPKAYDLARAPLVHRSAGLRWRSRKAGAPNRESQQGPAV